jgi:transposase
LSLEEPTPDHTTLSKTRRLMNLGTHKAVFRWVLKRLAREGLLSGKTLGVDATTLEANAALNSIVRRDNGASYDEHVKELMKTEGMEEPTPAERQRFDRRRKKSLSNRDWVNPFEPEARITKMKDGRTHLAYKAEHALDLETGAVVALTVQPGDRGDTATMPATLAEAGCAVTEMAGHAAQAGAVGVVEAVSEVGVERVVADKGHHIHGHSNRNYRRFEQLARKTGVGARAAKAGLCTRAARQSLRHLNLFWHELRHHRVSHYRCVCRVQCGRS